MQEKKLVKIQNIQYPISNTHKGNIFGGLLKIKNKRAIFSLPMCIAENQILTTQCLTMFDKRFTKQDMNGTKLWDREVNLKMAGPILS